MDSKVNTLYILCVSAINLKLQELVEKFLLLFEENRLATFTSWVFDDNQPCSAAKVKLIPLLSNCTIFYRVIYFGCKAV